ncbi:sigma 54-interacting transcriptional regulator [Azotosporobacter soli]|uniref:sigma 54-interacting transcriptional regulator n=1 Tax=Azotosporobacter soli TaxID=3055040 RepID=UPI0031FEFD4B
MKASILQEIQASVLQYAEIIAHVIKVDVEIVDSGLVRIAGTGVYKDRINEDMSHEGFVYRQVMQSGEMQLIEEPGQHELCTNCPRRGCCDEKMELCTPIKLKEEIIGVIGLICFADAQKKRLLEDLEVQKLFLLQIAEFISAKAYEHRELERNRRQMELLLLVMNNVDKGVLVLDQDKHILQINQSAQKQLQLSEDCLNKKVTIESTGDSLLGSEEYRVTIGSKTSYLMGELLRVEPEIKEQDQVFIFNEIKSIKSGIYDLTNVSTSVTVDNILGQSEVIRQLKTKIAKIAESNSTVLVTGESGTGKELIARAIHAASNRRTQPFIGINCGAIPDTLLESELFGYVKGAFTGADPRGKIGKFELANKGVLFLDEVGDMPLYLQVKLLRVLQERKLVRIGSNQLITLNVRVIAATNKDLKELIKEKKFREDLYYRLNVIPMEVPPLRQRMEDVDLLVDAMVQKYRQLFRKEVYGTDKETAQLLRCYPWPGNIRELENTVEFMINMADPQGFLTKETLPGNILSYAENGPRAGDVGVKTLREVEREHIQKTIQMYGDSTKGKQAAARQLGIGIATLYRKINELL